MIDIVVLGAQGRMGQMVQSTIADLPWAHFVLGLTNEQDILTFESHYQGDSKTTVIIDFSTPQATLSFLKQTTLPWPMVIGTTGFSSQQVQEIQNHARHRPILISANFSVGIAAMQRALAAVLHTLPSDAFDIHLYETHHDKKLDAPSGTALLIQRWIEKSPFKRFLPICVERSGDNKGRHQVQLSNSNETMTITHQAHQRTVFSSGALSVSRWLVQQPAGDYTLEDYLNSVMTQK